MLSSEMIACGMILSLCLVGASMAQNDLQEMQTGGNQKEMMRDIQGLLRSIQAMLDPNNDTNAAPDVNAACRCGGLQCTCCQHIRVSLIKLNSDCCLSVRYLKQNVGFLTTFSIGGRTVFSKEISLRNPLPICVGVPFLTKGASVCIQFNDLRSGQGWVHGCATLLGRLLFVTVARIRLGCFDIRYVDEFDPMNAVELPYYDTPNWIQSQQDTDLPVFHDEVVMMENIEKPLLERKRK